jgi:hypothetical protein
VEGLDGEACNTAWGGGDGCWEDVVGLEAGLPGEECAFGFGFFAEDEALWMGKVS